MGFYWTCKKWLRFPPRKQHPANWTLPGFFLKHESEEWVLVPAVCYANSSGYEFDGDPLPEIIYMGMYVHQPCLRGPYQTVIAPGGILCISCNMAPALSLVEECWVPKADLWTVWVSHGWVGCSSCRIMPQQLSFLFLLGLWAYQIWN